MNCLTHSSTAHSLRRCLLNTVACGIMMFFAATAQAEDAAQMQLAFQQSVAAVDPSVVRIETIGGVDLVGEVLTGTGPTTGCVVREDGYIITSSFNFLANPSSIVVTTWEGQKLAAVIVASDESRMLTLLKVNATGLVPLKPIPANEVRVGQFALALGRTFDLKFPNVSVGIVSAVNRIWGRALQTDAKTSPVNYGGPLIDLSGRCLGIIVPLSPDAQGTTAGVEWYDSGIGFAVPLTDIQAVLPRLIEGETLKPGLMGIGFPDTGAVSGDAKAIRVRPESPADLAEIRVDDVIVEINGKPVEKLSDLKHVLGTLYAKDVVHLKVKRGEEVLQKDVTLTDELKAFVFSYLGVLPDRKVATAEQNGVRVRAVMPGSPAEKAGIQSGDLIELAANDVVATTKQLAERVYRLQPGENLPVRVSRNGMPQTLSATLIQRPSDPPESLNAEEIRQPESTGEAKVGRFNDQLPNDGLGYWAYVPENYRPDYQWGILVWLHPTGDVSEAETLKAWSTACRERGVILVGPRAGDVSGWSEEHLESIKMIVDRMKATYQIDPARVVVMGRDSSGIFASQVAFKYRDLFRGLILQNAALRIRPPDADPESPLEFAFVSSPQHPQHKRVVQSFQAVKQLNLPAYFIEQKAAEGEAIPADVISSLAIWLDVLDRI
ncbi:PDZ domain-containing protein [Planctomicrobium sp. SH527]|uniref:PDZ domain-containing protein n=1 Tax=Planctomicrobium sp. SH527 TaxID=3448123 RepID=UPI003F5C18CD